jgi:hypothetical protein
MRPFAFSALVACAVLAISGRARAQDSTFVERKTADGQQIKFDDDPLDALANDPIGAQLRGFHPPRRCTLMRPRGSFVPEMLKSIEHM